MKKVFTRSFWATVGGVLTSVIAAIATDLDLDHFDLSSVRSWLKLLVIIIPAIGGALTEFKPKKKKGDPNEQ